jgi:hypothetical protein
MSQPQEPNKRQPLDPDEVTRLLKAGARKQRPRTWVGLLFWLFVLAVPLGVLLWWVRPRPAPPHLLVLAFDQVATPGEAVALRGQVWPADDEAAGTVLSGHDVFFVIGGGVPGAGREPWQAGAATGEDGAAGVEWQAPARAGVTDFAVRLPGGRGRPNVEDRGRAFAWPADTHLLIVEPESALTDAPASAWRKRAPADIPRLSGAADALAKASARHYQVVYLAVAADRAPLCRKVRDWVQLRPPGKEKAFPDGPVLGRPAYGDDMDEARARREVLGELQKRFKGPLAAVARQDKAARVFRESGLRTFLVMKEGEAPAGVIRVPSWAELADRLEAAAK